MAIVKNTSSEIGDILRIESNIPIVGIVTLNSFIDSTEGEFITPSGGSIQFPLGFDWLQSKNDQTVLFAYDNSIQSIRRFDVSDSSNEDFENYTLFVDSEKLQPKIITEYSGEVFALRVNNGFLEYFVYDSLSKTLTSSSITLLEVSDISSGIILGENIYFSGKKINDLWSLFKFNVSALTSVEIYEDFSTEVLIPKCSNDDKLLYLKLKDSISVYTFDIDTLNLSTVHSTPTILDDTWCYFNDYVYVVNNTNRRVYEYNVLTDSWGYVTFPVVVEFSQFYSTGEKIYLGNPTTNLIEYAFDTADDSFNLIGTLSDSRSFLKKFRYSLDAGVNFSDWMILSSINLSKIDVSRKDLFVTELWYERIGTDDSGTLKWNSTSLVGQIDAPLYPFYDKSIFKQFFDVNDYEVLGWAINVMEKLYYRGILPEYIKRGQFSDDPVNDDKDFVPFFLTMTHFFAIIVYYGRQYENITTNRILAREFILNRGLVLPPDEDELKMKYLLNNYSNEFRKRGTEQILDLESDGKDIDGELIRLIGKTALDEFIWGLIEPKKIGWCVGESSPMWSSAKGMVNLVKAYEKTPNVLDLGKYPLINSSFISIDADGGKSVMYISGHQLSGSDTGIGMTDFSTPDADFLVLIDPRLDYEISFKVKKLDATPLELTFDIHTYDENIAEILPETLDGLSERNNVFDAVTDLSNSGIYYSFRTILFGSSKGHDSDLKPSFKGTYFKSKPETKYVAFNISASDLNIGSEIYLYDIKLLPLNVNFTQGQLGIKSLFWSSFQNKGRLNDEEMSDFIKKYLISYKNSLKVKYVSD